jgi:hypothetical protein
MSPAGFHIGLLDGKNFHWHSWWVYGSDAHSWQILFSIWFLALPPLLVFAALSRPDTLARRRARVGLCPKCGYNLAGLASDALCPECGERIPNRRNSTERVDVAG